MKKNRKTKKSVADKALNAMAIIGFIFIVWAVLSYIEVCIWNIVDPSRINQFNLFALLLKYLA